MTKVHLLDLKSQIEEAKLRSPKRPLYSDSVKAGISHLRRSLSASQVSEELGVSESYVEKVKRASHSSKSFHSKKRKQVPELKFLELPQSVVSKNLETSNRLMKVTTSSGVSIEIWG